MRSPIYALVWEQWRQVRWLVAFGLVLTFLSSLSVYTALRSTLPAEYNGSAYGLPSNDLRDWVEFSTLVASISLVLIGAGLLFSHSSTRDLRMTLPPRMLTLPVSNARLAAAQVAFRFAMVVIYTVSAGLMLSMIDGAFFDAMGPWVGIALLCYAYASAIALTVGKRSPIAAFVILVLTVVPVTGCVVLADRLASETLHVPFFVCIAFAGGCTLVSFNGIFLLRNSPSSIPVRALAPAYGGRRGPSLLKMRDREAFGAEWRRTGWIVPCFSVATAVLSGTAQLTLVPFGSSIDVIVVWFVWSVWWFAPPASCFIAGMLLLARDHRDSVSGVATYFWTRPASVQQVVLHRMRAVAYSAIPTFLLPTALFVIGVLVDRGLAAMPPLHDFFFIAFLYFGLLLLSWTVVWVPYVPIVYVVFFSLYTTATKFNGIWGQDDEFWLLLAPDLLFAFALAWIAYLCAKRKIFDWRIIVRFAAIGAVCWVLTFYYFGTFVLNQLRLPSTSSVFIYGVTSAMLSFMPLFALLSYGVFLDRVRHGALLRRLPSRDW